MRRKGRRSSRKRDRRKKRRLREQIDDRAIGDIKALVRSFGEDINSMAWEFRAEIMAEFGEEVWRQIYNKAQFNINKMHGDVQIEDVLLEVINNPQHIEDAVDEAL